MPRILVFDDHNGILELYTRELQDEGYDVLAASSLRQALRYFWNGNPALVLFSIGRPRAELVDTIRQMLSSNRRTPMVLAGRFVDPADCAVSGFADACVEQQSDLTVLKQTIRDLCPIQASPKAVA